MKRGDLILVREPGSPAGKARPCVVVQRGDALDDPAKVTVCPLTSRLRGVANERPLVVPSSLNRLLAPSEVEVDWVFTSRIDSVGGVIGELDQATLGEVDLALKRWLEL